MPYTQEQVTQYQQELERALEFKRKYGDILKYQDEQFGTDELGKIEAAIEKGRRMIAEGKSGIIQGKWQDRYNTLTDPNSDLYKSFQSSLQKTLNNSTPTADSLLGVARAVGGDFQGSSVIANKQRESAEGRNREVAAQGTQGYYNQNQGLANSALGGVTQESQYGRSFIENARQFNENLGFQQDQLQFQKDSQPGFGSELLNIGATIAGQAVPGLSNIFGKPAQQTYAVNPNNGRAYYG